MKDIENMESVDQLVGESTIEDLSAELANAVADQVESPEDLVESLEKKEKELEEDGALAQGEAVIEVASAGELNDMMLVNEQSDGGAGSGGTIPVSETALYVGAGALTVGGVALAADDDDDGGNGGNNTPDPDPVVPQTFDLAVSSPTISEGDDGSKALVFTLTLSEAPNADNAPVTVNYQTTTAGTATQGEDFQVAAGAVQFAAGQTVATVTVNVNGDDAVEGDETVSIDFSGGALNAGQTATGTITNDDEVVVTPPEEDDFNLSVGADTLSGTSGNDEFRARVVQNGDGEQTNQLASGDVINGGGGTDTLDATVQAASSLNAGPAAAIAPETTSVENIFFEATTAFSGGAETVEINAKDLLGVNQIGSVDSDASLTIYNLTTLTNSGEYSERRNTSEITIVMDHSGNGDDNAVGVDVESDLTVLFDQNYLLAGQTTAGQANFFLLDQDAEQDGDSNRLAQINVDGIAVSINGGPRIDIDVDGLDQTALTHAGFVDGLQAPLQELIASGALPEGSTITLDPSITDDTFLDNGTRSGDIPAIVFTSGDGSPVTALGYSSVENPVGEFNVYGRFGQANSSSPDLITSNVILEKAGRGSDGGDLVIGGMSTDGTNTWGSGSGSRGVERFQVSVRGDNTQPSDVASMHSTNNTLQEVQITSVSGSTASLTIGNTQTDAAQFGTLAGLKDVRLVDGSTFNNGLTVNAIVTDETIEKYLNLQDSQENPASDNQAFTYTSGSGNDTFNVNIDKGNLSVSDGSTTREDFAMSISTGAGNDSVTLQIGDGTGVSTDAWWTNSRINENLNISTGSGDDHIATTGASIVNIMAGDGNDAVYTDNTGAQAGVSYNSGRATFVFNDANTGAADRNINDLKSAPRSTSVDNIGRVQVSVNFRGILGSDDNEGVQTFIPSTQLSQGGTVNDLVVRQVVKDLINNNNVYNELLVAKDGPSGTLVVESLIDGAHVAGDLVVTVSNAAFTTAQAANASVRALTAAELGDLNARFATEFAQENGADIVGAASTAENANLVYDGSGDDVIVLSTDATSVETVVLAMDHTPVRNDSNDAHDVIVNFAGNDRLQIIQSELFAAVGQGANTISGNEIRAVSGTTNTLIATFVYNNNTLQLDYAATGVQNDDLVTFDDKSGFTLANLSVVSAASREDVVLASPTAPEFALAAQTVTVAENTSAVGTFTATDPQGDVLTYSLTGTDAALFSVDAATGVVTFNAAPDFEAPADAGADNTYNFNVVASDAAESDSLAVTVNVTDVDPEGPQPRTVTVTAGGSDDASQGLTTYDGDPAVNGTFTVTNFEQGDVIDLDLVTVAPTIVNNDFADGQVDVQWAANGIVQVVSLTGLDASVDQTIFDVTTFEAAFGPGAII